MNQKKKNQRRIVLERQQVIREPLDQDILDSIGNPNIWTPEIEDAWMGELQKMSAREIHNRFPPMRKPGNVSLRGRSLGE